ncbi:MAG: hypothetical protein ACYTEQ_27140 [Planctomycetota bacterium]|jgi:hypothetical protein
MKHETYKKSVSWLFEVEGVVYAITQLEADFVTAEETRKNGQEDTHFRCDLSLIDGKWVAEVPDWLSDWEKPEYLAVEAFINQHGLPPEWLFREHSTD